MQNTNVGLQIHQCVTLWYLHKAQKGVHELGGKKWPFHLFVIIYSGENNYLIPDKFVSLLTCPSEQSPNYGITS